MRKNEQQLDNKRKSTEKTTKATEVAKPAYQEDEDDNQVDRGTLEAQEEIQAGDQEATTETPTAIAAEAARGVGKEAEKEVARRAATETDAERVPSRSRR